jgi:hypothetical protein
MAWPKQVVKFKPYYVVEEQHREHFASGRITYTVANAHGIRRSCHDTRAEAETACADANNAGRSEHYYQQALAAVQFLDEIGGPDDAREYIAIMKRIAEECTRRAWACAESHLYPPSAEEVERERDRAYFAALGFSWEYPGFYSLHLPSVHVTIGYDNGDKRFCIQLDDGNGSGIDWPEHNELSNDECETREEVAAAVAILRRIFT